MLALRYAMTADFKHLQVPALAASARADNLWRHTCFEAFVAMKDYPAYYEFNFSPSGQWAVYGFRAYRERMVLDSETLTPEMTVRVGNEVLELQATIPMARLPIFVAGAKLRLGLSAVIEGRDGAFSYWALAHPAAKPDFHHGDCFAMELAVPVASA